jgi:hypothetical protein
VTTSKRNIVDRLAAPESLLGMLQRGRGTGYLAALDAPQETVWPLLIEGVTNDPRLDRQCEDRAEYYTSLILATGMDLAPIYSHIERTDDREDDLVLRPPLSLETLMAAAERGSGDARRSATAQGNRRRHVRARQRTDGGTGENRGILNTSGAARLSAPV